MNGWLVFAFLLLAWLGIVQLVRRRGKALPGNLEFNGPFLFWRTQLGKKAIQKVAKPKRFWNVVADVGIVMTWITGILIFLLLIASVAPYFTNPEAVKENAPSPEFLIGIPGVNPLIPVGYGLAALIIALVIHEGSHGVMAYVAKMRVKSLGLVAFIIPVGAFVEPDEEDLAKATAREKNRVFAAGPTSNLFLALVAGVILSTAFLGNLALANDGNGVVVGSVEPASAAEAAGLQRGDILTVVNGTIVHDRAEYTSVMANTTANQTIDVQYLRGGVLFATQATLGDKYEYVERVDPAQNNLSFQGVGFLGIAGIGLQGIGEIKDVLQHPFQDLPSFFSYLGYPFFVFLQGVDVLAQPYSDLFVVEGPMAALPTPVFFGLAALLYWIVWINLMLGTFNALPAGPLDGGQMLRATLWDRLLRHEGVKHEQLSVERAELGGLQLKGRDPETQAKVDKIQGVVSRTTWTLGLFILGLILLPLFGPPLLKLFL